MTDPAPALEAVALVETAAIARGYVTLDAIAKRAPVTVKFARAVTPGKFLILFGGGVAPVTESLDAAREAAGSLLLDELMLPYAHHDLLPAIDGALRFEAGESVGVVETRSVAAALCGADAALKCSTVSVVKMRLAVGIGGKAFFNLAGPLADVEAALEAAALAIGDERLVGTELIARPHPEVRGFFG